MRLSLPALLAMVFPLCSLSASWRSSLYPENWTPSTTDEQGRFLHDFSYAGYHRGEKPIPERTGEVIDITSSPYNADPSGKNDVTTAIQSALDDAAAKGGGIVYMPAGTYRLMPPAGQKATLKVQGDNIVLRGAGTDKTFLFSDSFDFRQRTVIDVRAKDASWWYQEGEWVKASPIRTDLANRSTVIPVEDPGLFAVGDRVIVRNDTTERFIESLGMSGKWTPKNTKNRGLVFCRTITAIDPAARTVTIDIPTRYDLKATDNARVSKLAGRMITEVGLEDFSLGMKAHPGDGWGEEDYTMEGTAAHDVHQSHAIVFGSAENCWMRRVNSYCPDGNPANIHILSNGVKFDRSRLVTFEDCDWRHAQYQGGGGNGYLYTLHGNDCLIIKCRAEGGRHNFDFGSMTSSGNAIVECTTKDGRLASDFHMHFSVSNLFDNTTCDGDSLEAKYRPYGSSPIHGVTTSQSVFWNTNGLRYLASPFTFNGKAHNRQRIIVESEQFGEGYVIGTRGPASDVKTSNFKEGIGEGENLEPQSLYRDQLARRLKK